MKHKLNIIHMLLIIIIGFVLLFEIGRLSLHVPYNLDEISWFFHTQFYEELFLHRNIQKEVWDSYEAFDHPPLVKYIFGAYLHLQFPQLSNERRMFVTKFGRWGFYYNPMLQNVEKSPFALYIGQMREVNIVATVITIIFVIILLQQMQIHVVFQGVAVLLLLRNRIFLVSMISAQPDAWMTCLLFFSFLLFFIYVRQQKFIYLVFASLIAGLSTAAKLTGVVLLPVFVFYEIFNGCFEGKSLCSIIKHSIVIIGCTIISWSILNPTLYFSPIRNSIRYFQFRVTQSQKNQYFAQESNLPTVSSRLYAVYCSLISHDCANEPQQGHSTESTIVNIVLLFFGLVYVLRGGYGKRYKASSRLYMLFGLLLYCVFTITMIYLPTNSIQYFLQMTLFIIILQCFGLQQLYNFVKKPSPDVTSGLGDSFHLSKNYN
jgi:hypothetical protein